MIEMLDFNTIKFNHVNEYNNIYILINEDEQYDVKTPLVDVLNKIDKNIIYIEEQYLNRNFSTQLKNTNEKILVNNKNYTKIKILEDISIAWNENDDILFATIINEQVNIIDTDNITSNHYRDSTVDGYGGNAITRKAMEYNGLTNELKDITDNSIASEKQKLEQIKLKKEKINQIKDLIARICFILMFIFILIIVPLCAGKIVNKIIRIRKK